MFGNTAHKYSSLYLFALCMVLAGLFFACSGGGGSSQQPPVTTPNTGSIAFQVVWQNSSGAGGARPAPPFNACVDYGIQTISAAVSDGTTTVTSVSWPCSTHQGLITGVPSGSNYVVQINGLASGTSATIWSGQTTTINVFAGQTTNAGNVVMGYVGGDTTKPTVASSGPHSAPSNTTSVPITDRFDIVFSKPMAISTITSTNISLTLADTTPVPGNVIFNSATNTAAFVSSATLTYNTQYILQVVSCVTGSCITDIAGNQLASDFTNTFTTELAPGVIPAAPVSMTAKAGNGQVTLDWLASSGALSYNVYYNTSPGVTTTAFGSKISGAQAPAVHLGLTNSTTYYYIVTAVNSFGESLASAEVSTTPGFPAGNPLPPPSVSVTFNGTQNTITWPAVAGATSYNLYWSTRPIFPDKTAADNFIRNVTSPYAHMGLTNGQVYCYIVTAVSSSGESADSMQACGPGGSGGILIIWQ